MSDEDDAGGTNDDHDVLGDLLLVRREHARGDTH